MRFCRVWTRISFVLVWAHVLALPGFRLRGEENPGEPRDARLSRSVTLDDYHPWSPITDPAKWHARANRLREQVLVSAGLWPMPPRPPIEQAVIHGAIDRGDYTVEKVYFQSYPGFYVTGNLYRPRARAEGLRPAVLCPHGHWENGRLYERPEAQARQEIERGAEKGIAGATYPLQARCAMLARMGCVVFFYDMVGYADSRQIKHAQGFSDVEAALRLQSAFGLQTFNSIRAFDFLSSLPGVDPARIAVTGASGGGTQTFILCGVDDRPAVAFPAVMVSTAMQGGCVCENAHLLRVGTGNIELAALTAPRPLGMTGANDWTLEIESKGLPELRALYRSLNVPDNVHARCYPQFDHNYNQVSREEMYRWVNRHLKLGAREPIEEKPFEPVRPADLRVFDAGHSLPADAVEVAGLRKTMTELSDRALAELKRKDSAEFQRTLRSALRSLVVSDVPDGIDVEIVAMEDNATPLPGGGTARRGALGRRGTGERVEGAWLEPKSWNGKVIVAVGDRGLSQFAEWGPAGVKLEAFAAGALAAGQAVLAVAPLLTSGPAAGAAALPVDSKRHKDYSGYTLGYNRSLLGERVHDILTAVGFARAQEKARGVELAGFGEAGLWVTLAAAVAGDLVQATTADRPKGLLGDVKDAGDPRFLPGALKYGDWPAFAELARVTWR